MKKLKYLIKKIAFRIIKPPIIYNYNAQAGEDKIIEYLFSSMGINQISYIDIGANDPITSNNTYLFYLKNNTGVLVEPDPVFNEAIKDVRPKDIIVNAAISAQGGKEAKFYVFNDASLNTLSKEEADNRTQSGLYKLIATRTIQLLTIEQIIQVYLHNKLPDLVSLDVEGVDYDILASFDFKEYPVPVWVVETCEYSENHIKPKVASIIDLMLSKGYFVFADTYINTIFVNSAWFNNYNAK